MGVRRVGADRRRFRKRRLAWPRRPSRGSRHSRRLCDRCPRVAGPVRRRGTPLCLWRGALELHRRLLRNDEWVYDDGSDDLGWRNESGHRRNPQRLPVLEKPLPLDGRNGHHRAHTGHPTDSRGGWDAAVQGGSAGAVGRQADAARARDGSPPLVHLRWPDGG